VILLAVTDNPASNQARITNCTTRINERSQVSYAQAHLKKVVLSQYFSSPIKAWHLKIQLHIFGSLSRALSIAILSV